MDYEKLNNMGIVDVLDANGRANGIFSLKK
jgi:hypothetical protein